MAGNLGAAAEFSVLRFNGRTRPIPSTPVVATSLTRIVHNNPDRVQLTIVNCGSDLVTIGTVPTQLSNGIGVRLAPGGTVVILVDEDGEGTGYDWYGIANAGNQTLFVQEVVAE